MDKNTISELLGEKSKYLEEMIDASPSCLKIIDKEGRLLSMNCRGLNLIEAETFESVLGASVYDIVHPEDRQLFEDFNNRVCGGSRESLRFRIIGLKGALRWMESYAAPYLLANGETAHIAITNDISLNIENEKALKDQEELFKEASKLAELGKLSGNIAHELNNPLMIVKGNARQILRVLEDKRKPSQDEVIYYAQKIEKTVDRMSRIIEGLKSFSHNSVSIPKTVVNIDLIIDEALALTEEKFRSLGITIHKSSKSDLYVNACSIQLSQVFINLINNSFDAIENLEKPWIKIEVEKREKKVFIFVSDSGPGIPEKNRRELMTPFYTTKELGKGTGLGLSISLGIVKSHGGDFYLNKDSSNTQFVIELPLVSQKEVSESA